MVDFGGVVKADMDVAGSSSSKLPYRKLSVVLREEQEEESEDLWLVPDDDDSCGRGFFSKARGAGLQISPSERNRTIGIYTHKCNACGFE